MSKLAGERETAAANERHWIVRSSWLFGVNGRNFVDTMLGLAQDREEVIVVRDQIGCPTYTGHLAAGLIRLLDAEEYGIHHMAGGGRCSWYDFAVEIFSQAGLDTRVLSMTSDMLDRPAPRPAYSVLTSEREHPVLLSDWHEGLADYLAERAEVSA
jgi:dTDP-4-dehydrorhamnose reductase